jgi:hypothetical protein
MNNVQLSFFYKDAFERIRAEGAENVLLDLRR